MKNKLQRYFPIIRTRKEILNELRDNDELWSVFYFVQLRIAKVKFLVQCQEISTLKPNGVLVYSTCTIDEAENEDNVRWFIEKHPEFELDKSFAEGTGMKQILPGEHGSDGFFIARFIKSKL